MTVLGSFDPPDASADVCEVVFSEKQRHKLAGSHPADTIALCPHKMMSVPLTCTCLLGNDLRKCHKGMTLPAGYLSQTAEDGDDANDHDAGDIKPNAPEAHPQHQHHDLRPRGSYPAMRSSRRLSQIALSWVYNGTAGFAAYIDITFATAAQLANLIARHPDFSVVSETPSPCFQTSAPSDCG